MPLRPRFPCQSVANYLLGWTLNQSYALLYKEQHPERMHIVRIEEVTENPRRILGDLCEKFDLEPPASSDGIAGPSNTDLGTESNDGAGIDARADRRNPNARAPISKRSITKALSKRSLRRSALSHFAALSGPSSRPCLSVADTKP